MAGNRGGSSSSADARFPPLEQRRRWGGCWAGLSCFRSEKRGKRIVPASRMPDGTPSANRANGSQATGLSNQATTTTPLLAPPSSPASFTNSALPSTAQSPSCLLSMSANSPGGPSNVYARGPYSHETQLVSPPVFSTFTTEPSTAPLTPPPELAHLTTPSSPDVPFARFLSSSVDLKTSGKDNGMLFMSSSYVTSSDLQATYPLYPGSPASSLISHMSGTSGDGQSSFHDQPPPSQGIATVSAQDGTSHPRHGSSKLFGLDSSTSKNFMLSQDSSFFSPATSAQFYLDQAQQSYPSSTHCGGRLSLSREADSYCNGGNAHHSRHNKACITDTEEIEAYRASFGFSADEIISTPQYVEISDVLEDSFTMVPFSSNTPCTECEVAGMANVGENMQKAGDSNILQPKDRETCKECTDPKASKQSGWVSFPNNSCNSVKTSEEEELISKVGDPKVIRGSYPIGASLSDAEIEYRRGRSRREGSRDLAGR